MAKELVKFCWFIWSNLEQRFDAWDRMEKLENDSFCEMVSAFHDLVGSTSFLAL